jgi:hypothetical protein
MAHVEKQLLEMSRLWSFKVLQLEIVEVGDSIQRGPHSNYSVVERLVAEIEDLLVVIEDVYSTIFMGNP